MPANYTDQIDDMLAFDLDATFSGGQVSRLRANLLQQGQYALAINADLDRFGNICTRRGTKRIGDALPARICGLAYLDTPSIEFL